MSVLHLIRHSLTEGNERRLYYGSSDIPLSENGVRRILEHVEAGDYPSIEGVDVLTSGMLRTEQTLELIYGKVPHGTEPRLREMDFGKFEMHGYEELKDWPEYQKWLETDFMESRVPGGESGNDVRARAIEAAKDIIARDRDTLIVCHGGVILILMAWFFPQEEKNMYEWQPQPSEGYSIFFENGKPISYSPIGWVIENKNG